MSDTAQIQRLEALQIANATRTRNANLKLSIAAGSVDVCRLLEDRTESIRAFDAINSIRMIGPKKADRILKTAGIDRRKRVCELTERQASVLADATEQAIDTLKMSRERFARYEAVAA